MPALTTQQFNTAIASLQPLQDDNMCRDVFAVLARHWGVEDHEIGAQFALVLEMMNPRLGISLYLSSHLLWERMRSGPRACATALNENLTNNFVV
jgi:hypothetical protein